MRIAVAGGSIAGLSMALALARVGAHVEVFERAPGRQHSLGAGLGVDLELLAGVTGQTRSTLPHLVLTSRWVATGRSAILREPAALTVTAYHLLRDHLRASLADHAYHAGREVVAADAVEGDPDPGVRVQLAQGKTLAADTFDAVVCADGRLSAMRRLFTDQGADTPRYAGYVLWRGFVHEAELAESTRQHFFDRLALHVVPRSRFHLVMYPVPGEHGATEPGQRRLNWGWYYGTSEARLHGELLVDRHGERHGFGLPAGTCAPAIMDQLHDQAGELWPEPYADVVRTTIEHDALGLHPVYEYAAPRLARERVCLAGDAAHLASPITGAGARMAMIDALALEAAFREHGSDVAAALRTYEAFRLAAATAVVDSGRRLGQAFRAA